MSTNTDKVKVILKTGHEFFIRRKEAKELAIGRHDKKYGTYLMHDSKNEFSKLIILSEIAFIG